MGGWKSRLRIAYSNKKFQFPRWEGKSRFTVLCTASNEFCLFQKGEKVKAYSWDKKRENVDTSRYIVQQLTTGSEEIRMPGSINGSIVQISVQGEHCYT